MMQGMDMELVRKKRKHEVARLARISPRSTGVYVCYD